MFVTVKKSTRLINISKRRKSTNRHNISLLICFWFHLSTTNFFLLCLTQMNIENNSNVWEKFSKNNQAKKGGCSYKVKNIIFISGIFYIFRRILYFPEYVIFKWFHINYLRNICSIIFSVRYTKWTENTVFSGNKNIYF